MSRILQCSYLASEVISRRSFFQFPRTFSLAHSLQGLPHNGINPLTKRLNSNFKWRNQGIVSNFHTSLVINQSEDRSIKPSEQYEESSEHHQQKGEHEPEEINSGDYASKKALFEHQNSDVIQRLRRLSETSVHDYKLSEAALKKSQELARARKEAIERGEQWKWDQRNLRPSGPPVHNPNQNRRRFQMSERNWEEADDEFFDERRRVPNRYDGGQSDQQMDRWRSSPMSSSRYDDNERDILENYEEEMQKLKEKMDRIKTSRKQQLEQEKAERDKVLTASKSDGEPESAKLSNHTYKSSLSNHTAGNVQVGRNFTNQRLGESQPENPKESHEIMNQNVSYNSDDFNLNFAASEPDTFGNLMAGPTIVKDQISKEIQKELQEEAKALSLTEEDEEEEDDVRVRPLPGEGWSTPKLIKKVRALLEEKKLKEAVDLFTSVLAEGGFTFDKIDIRHHYNVLINECANVGYVDMAFRLYATMKRTGYKEKIQTISSLFNAIANSPWDKENNLDRIEKLLIGLKEKNWNLSIIAYTALIKAYGRLGETALAFGVVDQMIEEAKIKPDTYVFNMLLQACITDTKNGFRYALITWKKMQQMNIKPDIYTFNLLLRAIAECGIEIEVPKIPLDTVRHQIPLSDHPVLPAIVAEEDRDALLSVLVLDKSTTDEKINTQITIQNYDDPVEIDMKFLKKALGYPENRLALLGGIRGFLSQMVRSKVGLNLKTLMGLLYVSKGDELHDILQLYKTYKLKGTPAFYTVAIKKCYDYSKYDLAKDVIKLMHLDNVTPNIAIYGAMSLGCVTLNDAEEFLKDMDASNYQPNTQLMVSLLRPAIRNCDPVHVFYIMEETRKRGIDLDEVYLENLEKFYKFCQSGLISKEMGKPMDKKLEMALERNPDLPEEFYTFKQKYQEWLSLVSIKVTPKNPWKDEFEHFIKHKSHKQAETQESVIDLESLNATSKVG